MIVDTTLNGRPCTAMYMTKDFEPVDSEDAAELIKIRFMDEEGGILFLVPEPIAVSEPKTTEQKIEKWTADTFDEANVSRDRGRFSSGSAGGDGEAATESRGKIALDDFAKSNIEVYATTEAEKDKFIEQWNKHMGIAPGEFRDKAFGGLKGSMTMIYVPRMNSVRFEGTFSTGDDAKEAAGRYEARIDFDDKYAEVKDVSFNKAEQGKGYAKQIMASNIGLFRQLGVNEIMLTANVDVGGYAWARYGMVPSKNSWNELRKELRDKIEAGRPSQEYFDVEREEEEPEDGYAVVMPDADRIRFEKLLSNEDPKTIWEIADSEYGKRLLLDSYWKGSLNFQDPAVMTRLTAYVMRKMQPKSKALTPAERIRAQRWDVAQARAMQTLQKWTADTFEEEKVSRDKGKFSSSGGDSVAVEKPKKKIDASDFEKDDVATESDVEKISEVWNANINMTPAEFRDKFIGGKGTMKLKVVELGGKELLTIKGQIQDQSGKSIGHYSRHIDFENKTAGSVSLAFNDDEQGKGHGKAFLKANVDTYKELGLNKVKTYANVDVGPHAWAKYGYQPASQGVWESLQRRLNGRLLMLDVPGAERKELSRLINNSNPKSLWAISDHPRGKDLLKEDSGWMGVIDFADKAAMARFDAYVGKKSSGVNKALRYYGEKPELKAMIKQQDSDDDEAQGELCYWQDGQKKDAAIHESILEEGDEDAAHQVSIDLMVNELGYSREEAEAFLQGGGQEVK